jgi:hypothetical protein
MPLKLGKQPGQPRPNDLQWSSLAATVQMPSVPARFGHANMFQDWWMLGNGPDDSVAPGFQGAGDCVWAGAAHEHRLINKLVHKVDVSFTGKDVISDYSAATGYDPDDPSTDNGTDVHAALSYRRKTGILDSQGKRHKIGAYVAIDPKDWDHLRQATYIFGAVGIGFDFPQSAWTQFDGGQPWDVLANDGGIEGGHYVPIMGAPTADKVGVVTWGKRQEMTRAFYEKYNDESWVYITPEELNETGAGLHGFDMAKLNSFLSALKK